MANNPFATLRLPPVSDSVKAHLRSILESYLQANADRAQIPDTELRALHPLFGSENVWQLFKKELGL